MSEPWAANTVRSATEYTQRFGKPRLCTLSVMEITLGFEQESAPMKLRIFREQIAPRFEIVDLDFEWACLAGEIYAKLEARGHRIGLPDTGIAAVALHNSLTLATSNLGHFHRIIELGYALRLENWRIR